MNQTNQENKINFKANCKELPLRRFERNIARRVYDPVMEDSGWRRRNNQETEELVKMSPL